MTKILYVPFKWVMLFELMMLAGMAGMIDAYGGYWPTLGFLAVMCYVSHDWKIWAMLHGRK